MKAERIKDNEHVFVAGRTGSGKTFLSCTYISGFDNVIALDTKGFLPDDWTQAGEIPVFYTLAELQNFRKGKAIYQPTPAEMNAENYDLFFKWIYERQNTVCYVDELMSITNGAGDVPFYLKAILTRGRQRNTALWVSTQRPKGIPLVCISEASHFFIFDLNLDGDRQRIAEVAGSKLFLYTPTQYAKQEGIYKPYLFWYYNFKMENPILAQLTD